MSVFYININELNTIYKTPIHIQTIKCNKIINKKRKVNQRKFLRPTFQKEGNLFITKNLFQILQKLII